MPELRGTVRAPEFPREMEWLNTAGPLRMADLRGKVVLLDFWTYCCINCMQVIPDLKRLEAKYPRELVVIGVHSAKFTTEREAENIRQAILRYKVAHPVVNDDQMRIWREYGVRAWPTQALIDPAGKVVAFRSGEGVFDAFDGPIAALIGAFGAAGRLDRTPLRLRPERQEDSPLSFPGKVLADEAGGRLFVADSGHHRIVVASLADGAVLEIIGSGRAGLADGTFSEAAFRNPQGMALVGPKLYVADTDNHAIRLADLKERTVTTVARAAPQAPPFDATAPGAARGFRSPWALVAHGGGLYIAMAGSHQLWRMDLATGRATPYAGSGWEARVDGELAQAALAQPSGITTDGEKLYFADSEVSSIRSADLDPAGQVRTIVGGDLFDFGDVDGVGLAARLQHPLGVAYRDGALYVADTYNNKIKRVSLAHRSIRTFLGSGSPGKADGLKPTFDEPAGVSIAGKKLYIADTNNHIIRVADLATGRTATLTLKGLGAPTAAASRSDH